MFRVSPDGREVQLLTTDLNGPDGLAFSPDEKYFYVDNWDDKKKVIMRYQVNADGTLSNGKVFFDKTNSAGRGRAGWHENRREGKLVRFRAGRAVDHLTGE